MKDLAESIEDALTLASTELTEVLQGTAQENGWSEALSKSVNIGYAGNVLELNIPSDVEDQVFDQEYGTESTPPTAVLRSLPHHPKMARILERHVNDKVVTAVHSALEELI